MHKIKINENIEQVYINNILTEAFIPSAEKVRIIVDYLNKNYSRSNIDDISDEGFPIKVNAFNMLSSDGQVIKVLNPREMLLVLDDVFNNMIKDKSDRRKFLKQVITDWFYKRISNDGVLSVNYI